MEIHWQHIYYKELGHCYIFYQSFCGMNVIFPEN